MIEQGRQRLAEQQQAQIMFGHVFDTAISLLRAKGKPRRVLGLLKYMVIHESVDSKEPPVKIWVRSGANPDKAKQIYISVEGIDHNLQVEKKQKQDKAIHIGTKFTPELLPREASLGDASDALSSLRQLATKLQVEVS